MPDNFQEIAAPSSEYKEMAAMRITAQRLLNLQGETVESLAHIRVARREPNPRARWQGHHDRNAFKTAVTNLSGAEAATFTFVPSAKSIVMAAVSATGTSAGTDGASPIITGANETGSCAARASRRH